jgi:hypothetical protein
MSKGEYVARRIEDRVLGWAVCCKVGFATYRVVARGLAEVSARNFADLLNAHRATLGAL